MAEIESSGRGRKKTIDVNVIPFVDLMSVLVIFLLISAVWTQVSMIQIGTSIYSKRTSDDPLVLPPDAGVVLRVDVKKEGYVFVLGKNENLISLKNGEFDDESLLQYLGRAKELHPEKIDGAVQMSDELPYERLIVVMDTILKSGFTNISVLPGSPK